MTRAAVRRLVAAMVGAAAVLLLAAGPALAAEESDDGPSTEEHSTEEHVELTPDEARELASESIDDGGEAIQPAVLVLAVVGGLLAVAALSKAFLRPPEIDPHDHH